MMSVLDSPTINSEVADAILSNLRNAIGPLKVSEATKGIRKPKKITAADFKKGVRTFLEEQVQRGLVFRHSSGKGGIERFWHRDEKHLLQERSVELARTPRTLGDLKKTLGKEVKGVDGAFVEAVIRELVGDDQLFEHPAATKKGSPRFAVTPPPPTVPPLDEPKQKAAIDKLVTAARKILDASKVPPEDLLRVLRERLSQPGVSGTTHGEVTSQQKSIASHTNSSGDKSASSSELDSLILKEVANTPVVSLPDLRNSMPTEFRGRAFDEAVLRLATEGRIMVYEDAEPTSFSEAERAGYVQDGTHVYTTIAKRS